APGAMPLCSADLPAGYGHSWWAECGVAAAPSDRLDTRRARGFTGRRWPVAPVAVGGSGVADARARGGAAERGDVAAPAAEPVRGPARSRLAGRAGRVDAPRPDRTVPAAPGLDR